MEGAMEGAMGVQRWTFTWAMRAFFYLTLAFIAALILRVLVGMTTDSSAILGKGTRASWALAVAFFAAQGLLIWRVGPRNFVEARQEGLFVRNPLRDRLIRWSSITAIEPGSSGLRVRISDGTTVTAWAIQRSSVATLFGSRGRAARIIEQINSIAEAKGAPLSA